MSRECDVCKEALNGFKKTARFCSESCRSKRYRVKRRCEECELPHSYLDATNTICSPCLLVIQINIEKKTLKEIVTWLNKNCVCFYCGESATDREHVVPRHSGLPTWVVPACRECNSFAGAALFSTVREKAEHIKERRAHKYRKLLKMPEWTSDEIEEMGRGLRASIAVSNEARDIVKTQLDWDPLALTEATLGL